MKTITAITAAAAAWFSAATAALAEPESALVGFLDYDLVLKEYDKSKKAVAELQQQKDAGEAELSQEWESYKKLFEEATELRKELVKNPPQTGEERRERGKAIQDVVGRVDKERERLEKLKEDREGDYLKKYAAIVNEVTAEITAATAKIATGKKYVLVLNTSAKTKRQIPAAIAFDPAHDLTGTVLQAINAAAAAAPAAAPAK